MSSTTCQSDVAAQSLFDSLVAPGEFDVPSIDLSGAEFDIPDNSGNDIFDQISKLTEGDLTERTVGGAGMFDGLMESVKAHLHEEFSSNRLTNAQYVEAYVALTGAAMSNAVQFLLSKDQAFFQAALAQQQAQIAAVQTVNARVDLVRAKSEAIAAQADAKTRAAQYAHTMIMVASEDAKRCLTEKQSAQVGYETDNILPAQLAGIQEGTSKTTAEKNQILYQTSTLLPAQHDNIVAEKNVRVYTHDNVLPAQVANTTEDTEGKDYTNTFILPAQLDSIREQTEAHRAKTMDTRTDGSTTIAGSIGKQKALHDQQIKSYQDDAKWKVAKGILDTWITQKSLDDGLVAPTSLQDGSINSAMSGIRTSVGL